MFCGFGVQGYFIVWYLIIRFRLMMLNSNKMQHFIVILICLVYFNHLNAQSPFTDVTVEAGIVEPSSPFDPLAHKGPEYPPIFLTFGTGAGWVDYNKDGFLDLYISNHIGPNYMFKNNGDGTFTDSAEELGINDMNGVGSGVAFADYNNDGWDDLYLCNGFGDRLFRNNNGLNFTDVTEEAGFDVNSNRKSISASWGDYDNEWFC